MSNGRQALYRYHYSLDYVRHFKYRKHSCNREAQLRFRKKSMTVHVTSIYQHRYDAPENKRTEVSAGQLIIKYISLFEHPYHNRCEYYRIVWALRERSSQLLGQV